MRIAHATSKPSIQVSTCAGRRARRPKGAEESAERPIHGGGAGARRQPEDTTPACITYLVDVVVRVGVSACGVAIVEYVASSSRSGVGCSAARRRVDGGCKLGRWAAGGLPECGGCGPLAHLSKRPFEGGHATNRERKEEEEERLLTHYNLSFTSFISFFPSSLFCLFVGLTHLRAKRFRLLADHPTSPPNSRQATRTREGKGHENTQTKKHASVDETHGRQVAPHMHYCTSMPPVRRRRVGRSSASRCLSRGGFSLVEGGRVRSRTVGER